MNQPDNSELQDTGLADDADFKSPLKRVSYQPGMLLGLEATRSEQAYHRRHLNRHNYWLHGSGTVAGLRVEIVSTDPGNDTSHTCVGLHISPGVGVDGLGREVTVAEPWCIDLGAWLTTQYEDKENDRWKALIRDGYEERDEPDGQVLHLLQLKVTMRYQENPSGLQPVMAVDANAGTDPVKPSRLQDGVLFELMAERQKNALQGAHPFAAHNALPAWDDKLAEKLSQTERDHINAAAEQDKQKMQLAARLLCAFPDDNEALSTRGLFSSAAAGLARTLLARVTIRLTSEQELIVNPRRITVNNMVRPFLFSNAVLTQHICK